MRRREFITLVGGATAAWPFVANAQPTGKSWRIGQVIGGSAETNGHFARALEQRLGELGYRLGGNLVLVTRYASPQLTGMEDAIRSLIAEIDLGHLEKFFSPSRYESDSLTAMGHGRMERASHGADGIFRC